MRIWTLLLCCTFSAMAQPTVDAALQAAVDDLHKEYLEALKTGDAGRFAKLFNDDAVVMTPGAPMLQGIDAITRDREAIFARAKVINGAMRASHLEQSGDLAYELGRFSYTIQVDDTPSRIVEGKYITIWKRGKDGKWRYQVDAGMPD